MSVPVCSASCITLSIAVVVPGRERVLSRTTFSEHPCRDFVGSEQSVPEEVYHRKIGVGVQMMDKIGRVVSFVASINGGHQMALSVVYDEI